MRFGHSDKLDRVLGRDCQRERFRIGETDVFARENYDSPRDETEILASVQHFREPIHRAFLIRPAHAFDERADRVVVCVAGAIINDCLLLNAFLGNCECEVDDVF